MLKYFLSLFFILIFVVDSFSSQETKIDLSKVANYSIKPSRVFLIKNKLYIDYGVKNLYLSLRIPKTHNKGEIKRLKLDVQNITKKENRIEIIEILSQESYQKIITQLVVENKIKNDINLLEYKYKDTLGITKEIETEVDFNINKKNNNLKKELKSEKKLDKKISKNIRDNFIKISKKYSKNTKFIIFADNIADIVYLYVDTEKNLFIPLILPPYQKTKKDRNFFYLSGNFLYNFIVKNHIVPIIKSPITSVYRLFSTSSSILMEFIPDNINEDFYSNTNDDDTMMDLQKFNKFLDEDLGTEEFKANVKILIDGEEFFNDFLNSAKLATKSIFIETYIFKTDTFCMEVINFLKEISAKIDVRIIIDYFGSLSNSKIIQDPVIKDYQKSSNIIKTLKENSKIKARIHPDTWLISDHRKLFLIDNKKAYLGGMNVASEYRYTWHDIMISLEGPIVNPLIKIFKKVWDFSGSGGDFAIAYRSLFAKSKKLNTKETDGMINVRILTTSSTDYQIYSAQIEAIRRAQKRIYIENPYFTEKVLVEELVLAKKRGVDVKIILPAVNDMILYDKINLKIANYFIENKIEVYLYPTMNHVKAAIYDNWACLGSANFNRLSMFKNREINIAFYDEKTVNELLKRLFIKDFEVSEKYEKKVEIPFVYYFM